MATINNLSDAAQALLKNETDNGNTTDVAGQTGVKEFTAPDGSTVFTSTTDVTLGQAEHVILTGTSNANVVANDKSNLIVGNDGDNKIDTGAGDDQVTTGAGNDTINLGAGNDTVDINGAGTKVIDGGAGNDTFVIKSTATGSHTTFTGLNSGDKVRINADANGDGVIDLKDVDLSKSGDDGQGNSTITLTDGTSFTLTGVTGAFDGNIKYTFGTDQDGNLIVDLTDGTV